MSGSTSPVSSSPDGHGANKDVGMVEEGETIQRDNAASQHFVNSEKTTTSSTSKDGGTQTPRMKADDGKNESSDITSKGITKEEEIKPIINAESKDQNEKSDGTHQLSFVFDDTATKALRQGLVTREIGNLYVEHEFSAV